MGMHAKAFLLLAILAALIAPGCTTVETIGKLATTAAVGALKAELPGVAHAVLDEAKILADKGIEEASALAARKTAEGVNAMHFWLLRSGGLDPAAYDYDNDGTLSDPEMATALGDLRNKSVVPWYVQAILTGMTILGAGGGGFSILKTMNRKLEERGEARVEAKLKTMNGAGGKTPTT